MGLLDSFKSMVGNQGSKSTPAASAPSAGTPVKGTAVAQTAKPAPASNSIKVKFGDKMPYYDPEFGSLEVIFNGFADVRSESWAKDPVKGQDYIGSVITTTIKKGIMNLGNQQVPYQDLARHISELRGSCTDALKEKDIQVQSLSIATINLTAESKAVVDKAKKAKQLS